MAKYLVTGGGGFIGCNLVRYILGRCHDVVVLDDFSTGKRENLAEVADRIELIEGDIRDRPTVDRAAAGCEAILHQAALASVPRGRSGVSCRASKAPETPLELWSFESSPYCRIAREKLCELEIPYRLHNVAKGSPGRDAFVTRSGKMQVPYLADPNTGVEMFESGDIAVYLDETYGA